VASQARLADTRSSRSVQLIDVVAEASSPCNEAAGRVKSGGGLATQRDETTAAHRKS
jgi:hypothetical protein